MKKIKIVSFIAAAALMLTSVTACGTASAEEGSGDAARKSVTIGTLYLVNTFS